MSTPGRSVLESRGWTFRFVAGPPRLDEVVALYEKMGYEVRLGTADSPVEEPGCATCAPGLDGSKAVYTRREP
ncbi:MAG: hypothetical protein R3199_02870 [Gemmatimonadota bacterium]|nr:hypothetical protein [Gemmatimonadota bacterium]